MSRTRVLSVVIAAAVAMLISVLAPVDAGAATVTVSGSVSCSNGKNVQGVWVQSSAGGSRWASWWPMPGMATAAYFSTPLTFSPASSNVELHVGCGGTAASWWSTNLTPAIAVSSSRVLNATCASSAAGRRQSCSFPPKGTTATGNQGIAGYCTWGAYDKWRSATGYYPYITGNANQMDDRAPGYGWRVTQVPSVRAMIVFNSGGAGFGHVGWVTGVRKEGSVVKIDFVDMNGAGPVNRDGKGPDFGVSRNRTRDWNAADQRFILATP